MDGSRREVSFNPGCCAIQRTGQSVTRYQRPFFVTAHDVPRQHLYGADILEPAPPTQWVCREIQSSSGLLHRMLRCEALSQSMQYACCKPDRRPWVVINDNDSAAGLSDPDHF